MPLPYQHAVRIAAPAAAGPLSKARKQFNKLVRQLETERARLALWREELPQIRALAQRELAPLDASFNLRRRQLLVLFDQSWSNGKTTDKEREKLSDLICLNAHRLLQEGEQDELIKEIFCRHSLSSLDLENDDPFMIRSMVEAATGIDLDDDADLRSPRAIFEAIASRMKAAAHVQGQAQEQEQAARPGAREARHQTEESKLKQSVRDIFRKLASALHPDRETDPAEHARKTALMQRANVAYAANDLLALLELQLAVEQIDQTGLDSLADERISQYNRILAGQIKDIKAELDAMEFGLSLDSGWEFGQRPTMKSIMKALQADIATMKASVALVEAEIEGFSDIKKLKAWLKTYRLPTLEPGSGEP